MVLRRLSEESHGVAVGMRKFFKVPGKASIDALSSFVCAPAVGVMITNSLYKNKTYTAREACMITTSFSICSLGAYAFLSGMANCSEYYSQLIITSLILVFVMAAIMVRIPPLSKKADVYYDGEVQTEKMRQCGAHYDKDIFNRTLRAAERCGAFLCRYGCAECFQIHRRH